ncbi:hypothetical protein [Hahella chejuensis]|uniref:hypothetical protein n=1 Tax=Hahella chejuensis TaxID=158327 RepID=UPI0013053E45|nr:hypothetical protein [Hahella chejuensis]
MAMDDIDNDTMIVSLKAVYENIDRFKALLESESLSDRENVIGLIISYVERVKYVIEEAREGLRPNAPALDWYFLVCKVLNCRFLSVNVDLLFFTFPVPDMANG